MTVTLELINKLDTAVEHYNHSQPNKARKRVSEFLKATGKFQRHHQMEFEQQLLHEKLISKKEAIGPYLKVLHLFLDAKGKHPRRNSLAKILVEYLENLKSPRKGSGQVYNFGRESKKRVSTKNLMDGWVLVNR